MAEINVPMLPPVEGGSSESNGRHERVRIGLSKTGAKLNGDFSQSDQFRLQSTSTPVTFPGQGAGRNARPDSARFSGPESAAERSADDAGRDLDRPRRSRSADVAAFGLINEASIQESSVAHCRVLAASIGQDPVRRARFGRQSFGRHRGADDLGPGQEQPIDADSRTRQPHRRRQLIQGSSRTGVERCSGESGSGSHGRRPSAIAETDRIGARHRFSSFFGPTHRGRHRTGRGLEARGYGIRRRSGEAASRPS